MGSDMRAAVDAMDARDTPSRHTPGLIAEHSGRLFAGTALDCT
jgi:hypothetical protein